MSDDNRRFAKLGQPRSRSRVEALSQARLFVARTTPAPGSQAALGRVLEGLAKVEADGKIVGVVYKLL